MSPRSLGNGRAVLHPQRRRRQESGAPRCDRVAQARAKRARRWSRRAQLRKITSIGRVRRCGYCTDPNAGPTLAVTENGDGTRTAGYGGLATCGSVWVCPQCAAKIATGRADELSQVMRAVDEAGGSAFMLTLNMRHRAGDRLGLSMSYRERLSLLETRRNRRERGQLSKKDADRLIRLEERDRQRLEELGQAQAERDDAEALGWGVDERQAEADSIEEAENRSRRGCWDACADGWKAVTEGKQWQADKELFGGLLGWAKVVEVTDGLQVCDNPDCVQRRHGNRWHVHIHALLCSTKDVPVELVCESIGALAFGRWSRALERHGFDASEEHGWDVRKVRLGDGDLADYFTKVAHEVTGSHHKEGRRKGGRTPMQLLADAVETYRVEDLARWWEWEAASQRRQQLTWSRGRHDLRTLAGLGHERSDEELAEDDLGEDVRLGIERESWDWIEYTGRQCELLGVSEEHGLDGARAWLSGHGLRWVEATGAPPAPSVVHQPYGWRYDAHQPLWPYSAAR